jgi:hypothetical protein
VGAVPSRFQIACDNNSKALASLDQTWGWDRVFDPFVWKMDAILALWHVRLLGSARV